MHPTPPVLFLVFNRPDLAKQVFAVIRAAKPSQLFIAADGPRLDRPEEYNWCEQCRALVQRVDWPCEVKTLFREANLGCKQAVSSAITWFFENVEEGIMIEEDLVPHPSFFPYCAELLERYRNDLRVGMIGGYNDQPPAVWKADTYYFSIFLKWGGAGAFWRRSWLAYDGKLEQWPRLKQSRQFKRLLGHREVVRYWTNIFDRCYRGGLETAWDYPWLCSLWAQGMLSIAPGCNLVTNIGFDERATNTQSPNNFGACRPTRAIQFPLRHPTQIKPDRRADIWTAQVLGIPVGSIERARRLISKIAPHIPRPLRRLVKAAVFVRS